MSENGRDLQLGLRTLLLWIGAVALYVGTVTMLEVPALIVACCVGVAALVRLAVGRMIGGVLCFLAGGTAGVWLGFECLPPTSHMVLFVAILFGLGCTVFIIEEFVSIALRGTAALVLARSETRSPPREPIEKRASYRWHQFTLRRLLLAVVLVSLLLSLVATKMNRLNNRRRQLEIASELERHGANVNYVSVETRHGYRPIYVHAVNLTYAEFGDRDLTALRELQDCVELDLPFTNVSDQGLANLRGANVEYLDLRGTKITDAGLLHLAECPRLEMLFLGRTDVTPEGVKRLREAIPECKIDY